jgi:hypothetical protein
VTRLTTRLLRRWSNGPRRSSTAPREAVAIRRALGLMDRDINQLANAAPDSLLGPDSPDGTVVRAKRVKQFEKNVYPGAAKRPRTSSATHGDPTPLLELGFVPPEVGVAAGYPCASDK